MGGHAEEIQTNIAMFASQIHETKERETVNTDMQTAIQKALEGWLSPGSARVTLRHMSTKLGQAEHMAGLEGHGCHK